MVVELIKKYVDGGGKVPYGVVMSDYVEDDDVPIGVLSVRLSTLRSETVAVMPLQTVIDLSIGTTWLVEGETDES